MKRLVLLGASGSIGMQTIDVVRNHPEDYSLVACSVGKRIDVLRKILSEFKLQYICVENESDAIQLRNDYPETTVYSGDAGLQKLACLSEYDMLVNALVGFVGLEPTLAALNAKHDVALANKETLVVGGELINEAKVANKVNLYPIDSEHSAIFQCLQGAHEGEVRRLIVTASGGSFRKLGREQLKDVTVEQALAHPNWSMGAKITIDSATMMNKGFEVMEAHWLFDIPYDQISVLMHDESIIHSMVEFKDHAVLAQLGVPDMRIPIQYALSYPYRIPMENADLLDLAKIGTLHFKDPDFERYPLLKLAYEVGKAGGILPAVMNAANEEANLAFREGRLSFLGIEDAVIGTVNAAEQKKVLSVDDLRYADSWARSYVKENYETKENN